MRYAAVNSAWPPAVPTLTGPEAASAARRLYRFGMKRAWKGPVKLTSGNRYTWIYHGELRVNPGKGWRGLVHDMSHLVHRYQHPDKSGHDMRHEFLEGEMVAYVIASGWLQGKLKPKTKPKPPLQEVRHARVLQRLADWKRKAKRAATAIRKLERQRKYYERKGETSCSNGTTTKPLTMDASSLR